jgi:hypothetical protein
LSDIGSQPVAHADAYVLLEIDAVTPVQELLDAYPDEATASWTYGRTLHEFRRQGDTPETRRLLNDACTWNPPVPACLTGRKRLPRRLPELIGQGDEAEAVVYAAGQLAVWQATPRAVAWLRGIAR